MPKYIPSLPFEDCYGSVGEKTYYHRNGVCYYKKRARPAFPGTMLQMEHQTMSPRNCSSAQDRPSQGWHAVRTTRPDMHHTCSDRSVMKRPYLCWREPWTAKD